MAFNALSRVTPSPLGALSIGGLAPSLCGMSADQNQHYLPQSYQRGWIDASGRLHVYRWAYNKLVRDRADLTARPRRAFTRAFRPAPRPDLPLL